MVKKMTNNMSLKSLKISWWGQNSVAGHILLPSASGGSKNRFLMWGLPLYSWWVIIVIIYLSSGDPRQREDQHQQVDHDGLRCEHLLILGSHLPPYTSLPAQVLDSMLRILSNILIILHLGQTICATSTPSLCSPLWLGAVLEKWKKFHPHFNDGLPS